MGDDSTGRPKAMGRRTVVSGAAWAAPVVTLGMAAPAVAASPPPITPSVSWSCRPGKDWRYTVQLTLSNGLKCGVNVSVQTFKVRVNGQTVASGSGTVFVPAGGSRTLSFTGGKTRAIGQGAVTLTYAYQDCGRITRAETKMLSLSPLGHCKAAVDDGDGNKTSEDTEPTSSSSTPAPEMRVDSAPDAAPAPVSVPEPAPATSPATVSTPTSTATTAD